MDNWYEELTKIVEKEFSFLRTKYGFGKVIIRNWGGREFNFDFERDAETIRVSYWPGQKSPLIEMFIPSEKTNIRPTPWAEKGEIQRSRLFPENNIKLQFNPQSLSSMQAYIGELASEFERSETELLNDYQSG